MKVVCIVKEGAPWGYINRWYRKYFWQKKKQVEAKGPKKDDVVTIEKEYWADGVKWYIFVEWPNTGSYNSKYFRPVEENYEAVSYSEIKEKSSVN